MGGMPRSAIGGVKKPRIGITMGDPSGIGPEIVVKACGDGRVLSICEPYIIGIPSVFERAVRLVPDAGNYCLPSVLSTGTVEDGFGTGMVSAATGTASYEAIRMAVEGCKAGRLAAMVTAPIYKESIQAAGIQHPGHTEIIAALTGSGSSCMLLLHDNLRVAHVTTHDPLRRACDLITRVMVLSVIRLAWNFLLDYGITNPKIGVSGLNPHAGEGGMFGAEEIEAIQPAVMDAVAEGISVFGPLPADSLFPAARDGAFDAVVAMYHDQGHIPVKMAGFRKEAGKPAEFHGVNVSLGLPIIRTSVDHGTAFNLAWQGIASAESMIEAIITAALMSSRKDAKKK